MKKRGFGNNRSRFRQLNCLQGKNGRIARGERFGGPCREEDFRGKIAKFLRFRGRRNANRIIRRRRNRAGSEKRRETLDTLAVFSAVGVAVQFRVDGDQCGKKQRESEQRAKESLREGKRTGVGLRHENRARGNSSVNETRFGTRVNTENRARAGVNAKRSRYRLLKMAKRFRVSSARCEISWLGFAGLLRRCFRRVLRSGCGSRRRQE